MESVPTVLEETTNRQSDSGESRSGLSSTKQWVHLRQQLAELRQSNSAKAATIEQLQRQAAQSASAGVCPFPPLPFTVVCPATSSRMLFSELLQRRDLIRIQTAIGT